MSSERTINPLIRDLESELQRYRDKFIDRFFKYVRFNTQSQEDSSSFPSTPGQRELARELLRELQEMGISQVSLDENGYLIAKLPSNSEGSVKIGFLAHLDTSPEAPGGPVNPKVVRYEGKAIGLGKGEWLSPEKFPVLNNYLGEEIIVTDGTTLLGADDKAGIAEIMTALEFLMDHPELPRPHLRIAFTPDEEIGRGMEKFNVKEFDADYAYTVDGEGLGTLEYETFNAATGRIKFKGINVHPGYAKGIMRNALIMANQFISILPRAESPEHTEGYEGYYHVLNLSGNVSEAKLKLIIRDHNRDRFERRKEFIHQIAQLLKFQYGEDSVEVEIEDTYYNMREVIEKHPEVLKIAREAIRESGLTPVEKPVRGGTDGAKLSFMGVPTPNIFSGGHNFHSVHEFLPIRSAMKAIEVIIRITYLWAEAKGR